VAARRPVERAMGEVEAALVARRVWVLATLSTACTKAAGAGAKSSGRMMKTGTGSSARL
jgi:hypothetical protein